MNHSRTLLTLCGSVLVGTAVIYGCSDNSGNTLSPKPDSGAAAIYNTAGDAAAGDGASANAPPALGVQIDRFGRPAINTAANHTFDPDASTHDKAEDDYNASSDRTAWKKYVPEIAANLGVYDGLDLTCGNQAFADPDAGDNGVQRYRALATLLADDRQWLDTSTTTCAHYLSVELSALQNAASTDCGGRTLGYDVIDTTYNAVAATLASGTLTDGVPKVAAKTEGTTFPYLSAPAPPK